MGGLIWVCFLHLWWRSDLTGSPRSAAFLGSALRVLWHPALKEKNSTSATLSQHQLQDAFEKKRIFYSSYWKAQRSKPAISFSVTVLSCAHQMPLTSLQCTANPCRQPFPSYPQQPVFETCRSLKDHFSTCKGHAHLQGLTYQVKEFPKLGSGVTEASCSPWTPLAWAGVSPCSHTAFPIGLLPHKLSIFRYYPEFLAEHPLAARCPCGSDASNTIQPFASAEKLAPILWIYFSYESQSPD